MIVDGSLHVGLCHGSLSFSGKRNEGEGGGGVSSGHAGVRLLSALLTEMDGMELATGTAPLSQLYVVPFISFHLFNFNNNIYIYTHNSINILVYV